MFAISSNIGNFSQAQAIEFFRMRQRIAKRRAITRFERAYQLAEPRMQADMYAAYRRSAQ